MLINYDYEYDVHEKYIFMNFTFLKIVIFKL